MAKSKYETHVAPFLDQIAAWKKQGISLEEMASKLNVAESTIELYLKKGREGKEPYSEFSVLIDTIENDLVEQVEAALFKKTQGYNAKIAKHIKVKVIEYDETTGRKRSEREEIREVFDEVHVPADTQAQIFFLTRRAGDKWPFKPADHVEEDTNTGVIMMDGPDVQELQPTEEEKKALEAKFGSEAGI